MVDYCRRFQQIWHDCWHGQWKYGVSFTPDIMHTNFCLTTFFSGITSSWMVRALMDNCGKLLQASRLAYHTVSRGTGNVDSGIWKSPTWIILCWSANQLHRTRTVYLVCWLSDAHDIWSRIFGMLVFSLNIHWWSSTEIVHVVFSCLLVHSTQSPIEWLACRDCRLSLYNCTLPCDRIVSNDFIVSKAVYM